MSLGFPSKRHQMNSLNLDLILSKVPRYNPQVKFKIWKEQSWYIASKIMIPNLSREQWFSSEKL